MAGLMRREPHVEAADIFGRFDKMFEEWARMMPFRPIDAVGPWTLTPVQRTRECAIGAEEGQWKKASCTHSPLWQCWDWPSWW
jgi:hypothetical protein